MMRAILYRSIGSAMLVLAAVAVVTHVSRGNPNGTCQPTWTALGTGIDGQVFSSTVFDPDGAGPAPPVLVVGGTFTSAGGQPANNIAMWDGSAWHPLGTGVDDAVWALAAFDEDGPGPNPPVLFAGGYFITAGGVVVNNIARWDGANWSSVEGGAGGKLRGVLALTVFDENGSGQPALFAGGEFTSMGGISTGHVARWNGTTWSAVGDVGSPDPFDFVSALASHDEDGPGPDAPSLFVGGIFSNIGGISASNIARWDGTTWSDVGGGTNGFVDDLAAFDEDGPGPGLPALFATGSFSQAGGVIVNGIGRWNGTSWSSVGGGLDGPGAALAVFDEDGNGANPPRLFLGGNFITAGGVTVNYLGRWDGSAWSSLGSGMDARVLTLAPFEPNGPGGGPPALVAGGVFSSAGGVPASRVAAWVGCPAGTPTPTPTASPTPTPTATATATPTFTPSPTPRVTPSPRPRPTPHPRP